VEEEESIRFDLKPTSKSVGNDDSSAFE